MHNLKVVTSVVRLTICEGITSGLSGDRLRLTAADRRIRNCRPPSSTTYLEYARVNHNDLNNCCLLIVLQHIISRLT